jgi:hypothetical protein
MFDGEPSSDDQFHDFSTARPEPFSEAELQRLANSRRLKNTALRALQCCARKSENGAEVGGWSRLSDSGDLTISEDSPAKE